MTVPAILLAFPIGGIGPMEMVIVGVIAVLLFGKRLPEVGRSLGRSFLEFKKGISGIENEFSDAVNRSPGSSPAGRSRYNDIDDRDEATAPKFEPPKAETSAETPA